MTVDKKQGCCERHDMLIAQRSGFGSNVELADMQRDEDEFGQQTTGFSCANDDMGDNVRSGSLSPQHSDIACLFCGGDCVVRYALKLLGLDNPALWAGKSDER